jgi:hypothetical protein
MRALRPPAPGQGRRRDRVPAPPAAAAPGFRRGAIGNWRWIFIRRSEEGFPCKTTTEALKQVYTTTRGGQGPRFVSQLTREAFAVVLAGGRGSRLKQLTDWRSKPAVPFAGKFRIIDFTLSNCVNSGIRRIGVATQYKAQSLIHHLQRGWSFLDGRLNEFIDLLPAQQQVGEEWYKGTADAVFQNLDMLRRNPAEVCRRASGDPCLQDGLRPHAGLPRRRAGRPDRGLHRGAARGGQRLRRHERE